MHILKQCSFPFSVMLHELDKLFWLLGRCETFHLSWWFGATLFGTDLQHPVDLPITSVSIILYTPFTDNKPSWWCFHTMLSRFHISSLKTTNYSQQFCYLCYSQSFNNLLKAKFQSWGAQISSTLTSGLVHYENCPGNKACNAPCSLPVRLPKSSSDLCLNHLSLVYT